VVTGVEKEEEEAIPKAEALKNMRFEEEVFTIHQKYEPEYIADTWVWHRRRKRLPKTLTEKRRR
jgi:hypothetical protein